MRLTLDITPNLLRSAGIRNHLYYWANALEADRMGNLLDLYPFLSNIPPLNHDRGIETGIPNWRLLLVFAMNRKAMHPVVRALVPRAEVFHGSPQLRRRPRARLLTAHIHDLTCWLLPEFHTPANVQAAYDAAEHVWKQADRLIAVSASARVDAVRLLGLDPERIEVIPHGVPEQYFVVEPDEVARVRSAWELTKPYALTVGTIEPRKNIDALLDSWKALPQDVRDEFDLVIAGPAGWRAEQTLARLRAATAGVRYLGYVPEADLAGLTAGAAVHAYPSLYEGFGFPLAQAMAASVPSVTSNVFQHAGSERGERPANRPAITSGVAGCFVPSAHVVFPAGRTRSTRACFCRGELPLAGDCAAILGLLRARSRVLKHFNQPARDGAAAHVAGAFEGARILRHLLQGSYDLAFRLWVEKARAIFRDFDQRRQARARYGNATGQGLKHGNPEPFEAGRINEGLRFAVQAVDLFARNPAGDLRGSLQIEFPPELLDAPGFEAFQTNQNQAPLRMARVEDPKGAQQSIKVLVRM